MTNEAISEFPLKQNSYAAFDAFSLRNLIIQRLNEQGLLTDQNYIGSNLASIIDIISFSFNTLIYYLNQTSTESMFTEAQLYENISRIVKVLDYKPIGYQTSTVAFQCSADDTFTKGIYTIPRYSHILVGGIPFSFNEDVTFSVTSDNQTAALTDLSNKKLLYQGIFRENSVYTATGDNNEVVSVDIANVLIDHFNVHVYVYEKNLNKWVEYQNVPNLFTENSFSRTFEKQLNSNLKYNIIFGDGISGRKLAQGDRVAIYFLQSSGENGLVGPGTLNSIKSTNVLFKTTQLNSIMLDVNQEKFTYVEPSQFKSLTFNNAAGSTIPKNIETADSIRKNAPLNFKSQYRLVTAQDFESFIETNFANFVSDVKVFSNWDYTGKYLKYFHDLGLNPGGFQQVMLNQVLFADACNFNNVYICATPKISQSSSLKYLLPAQKEVILSNINPIKTITTEVTFMDPIFKAIALGVRTNDVPTIDDCVLEIVKKTSNRRSVRSIQQEIASIFAVHFNPINIKLGYVFDYAALISKILSVDGVFKMRTKKADNTSSFEGLSFYLWNPVYPDLDKQTIASNITMGEFELLYFNDLSTIDSKILVVEER